MQRIRIKCRICGLAVDTRDVVGGDGTALRLYRHPNTLGEPCEGSGDLYSWGSGDWTAADVEAVAKPPDDTERGPIQRKKTGRWCAKRLIVAGVLYQLQYIRCGNKRCKRCKLEDPAKAHGPYWFRYTTKKASGGRPGRGGEWQAQYIGVDTSGLPPEFHTALALLEK